MPHIAIDHLGCRRDNERFYPFIYEGVQPVPIWADGVVLPLKAHPRDDLDWSHPVALAKQLAEQGKWIMWELDLGLADPLIDLTDPTTFYSHTIALQEFSSQIWKEYSQQTIGIILYRGPGNFFSRIKYTSERFLEDKERDESCTSLEIYSARLFGEYLHRLLSFLPEDAAPFALIDAEAIPSHALTALMLSRRYFEFLHLAIKGSSLPIPGFSWERGESQAGWIGSVNPPLQRDLIPSRAVCLPRENYCQPEFISKLESLLYALLNCKVPFRLICEEHLTEEWNDLEELILFLDRISSQGKRMLQGFIAAGGMVTDADTILLTEGKEALHGPLHP
jgi:hypothetical protein